MAIDKQILQTENDIYKKVSTTKVETTKEVIKKIDLDLTSKKRICTVMGVSQLSVYYQAKM